MCRCHALDLRSPGEGSKQSQVSALPERRVKKQRLTALMGYMSIFGCSFFAFHGFPGDELLTLP